MKKAKVSINEGSPGRVFFVFDDVESAYEWLAGDASDGSPKFIDEIPNVDQITLLPGEFIEAEWRGCEFVYDDKNRSHVRLDWIRFVKASKPQNASGLLVSVHFGWVSDHILPFRQFKDADITVDELTSETSTFDFEVLFKDVEEEDQ